MKRILILPLVIVAILVGCTDLHEELIVKEDSPQAEMSRGVSESTLLQVEEMYNAALNLRNQFDPEPMSRLEVGTNENARYGNLFFILNPYEEEYTVGEKCDTMMVLVNLYKDKERTEPDGYVLMAADKRIKNGVLSVSTIGNIPLKKGDRESRYVLDRYSVYFKETVQFIDWAEEFIEVRLLMEDPNHHLVSDWRKGYGGVIIPWDGDPRGNITPQTIHNWRIVSGFYPWLKTQWGQEDAYAKYFHRKNAGAEVTALAQILAYYKEPIYNYLSCNEYSGIINPNWNQILEDCENNSGRLDEESTPVSLNQVAALYRYLGEKLQVSDDGLSTVDLEDALSWINNNTGINSMGLNSYEFSTIKNAIEDSMVVICNGGDVEEGRTWLIDGYVFAKDINEKNSTKHPFVHCNWGRNGDLNGYYNSDVFSHAVGITPYLPDDSIKGIKSRSKENVPIQVAVLKK